MCRDLKPENLLIEVGDFGFDGFGFATVPTTRGCTLCCEYAYALCEYLGGKGNWKLARALHGRYAPTIGPARRRCAEKMAALALCCACLHVRVIYYH